MRITYRGTFSTNDKERLGDFLKLTDRVTIDDDALLGEYYISNDSVNFDLYQKKLKELRLSAPNDCNLKFTKKELSKVRYWKVRSTWRNGYPADENEYLKEHFGKTENITCDCNLSLTHPVSIKKLPNFKNRNFFQLFWLESLLFCSEKAKVILEKNHISGIEILPTYKGKLKRELVTDTYQLKILNKTKYHPLLKSTEFRFIEICKECNSMKVYSSWDKINKYMINDFDLNDDIFYSNDIFNSESIIISTRLKDILEKEKLDKGLEIHPVYLNGQDVILGEMKQLDYSFDERRMFEDVINDINIPVEHKINMKKHQIYDYEKYIELFHSDYNSLD